MNPLDQLRDEIANLHLLADRLARKSAPYHDLVAAADAMRALFPKAAHDCLLRECSIVDAYDTARARHAEGAKPSGAPYKSWIERCAEFEAATTPEKPSGAPAPSVEEITRIVRDADQDFEGSGGSTRHWVRDCFLPALEKSGLRIVGAPASASPCDYAEMEKHATHCGRRHYMVDKAGMPPCRCGAPAPASAQGEVCEKPDAASPVKTCPFGPVEASVERFLRAIEARLDVDDDDAHILSRDGLELLKIAWSNRRTPAPSPAGDPGDWTCRCGRHVSWPGLVCAACGHEHPWKPAPSPATGESASPPSEQTAKELDELLAVFAKGDGDDEDCWTQPARRAQLYVASLRAEVERLRSALAEKEKAGVNANAVVERCIELVVRKKTPSWDEVSVWCDALRTALGAKETR